MTLTLQLSCYTTGQWRTHGGVRGVKPTPPPIEDIKRNENLSFWNEPPFFIQRLPKLLSCFSVLSNLLIKSCDAMIGLLIVKLCLCAALDVDDFRKSKTFLVFKAKSFLRTVTVSGAGGLCFPGTPIMCLRVSHDIDAVILAKNTYCRYNRRCFCP